MFSSGAQGGKGRAQTAHSSEEKEVNSIDKAGDNGIFALSVVKFAPQGRPETT